MTAAAAVADNYARLLAAARDPEDIATIAFTGVLARFRIQGLDASALSRLLRHYFPGTTQSGSPVDELAPQDAVCTALSTGEFDELLALLREHRRDDSEETEWVSRALVSACAGADHLWQDMGLPDRDALSRLIRHYFPILYYKNSGNVKWKKFFYRQLCDRAEIALCKAPSCGVCSDYAQCFGRE
jgi:nitrogen fixation protein NifQ